MTTIPELGARLNVPVSDLIKLGEKQVMNPDSVLAKSLAASIAARLVTLKAASNDSVKKKRERSRVYLQHAVPLEYRYDITNAFPMFDIHYSCADIRSGAVALAVSVCISEYMLSKFNIKQGNVIAYGVGIKQLLTRNRHWVHLCVSGSSLRAQANFFREDRAVAAIANTMKSSGQRANLAKQYVTGAHCIHCTNATGCNVQAKVGVMMLAGVDTNFRQVAYFMRQHGTRLLYFAVPGSKEMEMGVEGKFPELDGYVFPSHGGERINLCFKNASTENMTHTYANYLELIARTSVVLDGVTYHKEFDSRIQGFLVYKVTRIDGVFKEAPPPYKSWIEPKYKDKYMVYIPELINGGNVHSASNWSLRGVPIDRDIIDDVVDFAMRAQGVPDIAQRISRRMFTRTSNFTLINQVVENTSSVPVHLFDSLCLAIYCAVFMAKFNDGKTVATLAPFARTAAMMAEKSFLGVAKEFMAAIIGNVAQATSVVTDTLRKTYYEVVANETLPMPSFAVCPGYVEYTDTGSSNPRFKGWSNGEYGATSGFSLLLPSMCFDGTFAADDSVSVSSAGLTTADDYVIAMIATGEGYINENRQVAAAEHDSVITVAKSLLSSVHSVFTDVPSFDVDEEFQQTVMATPNSQVEVARQQPGLYARSQQKFLAKSDAGQVKDLTTRIADDTGRHVRVTIERHTQMQPMFVPQVPEVIPGSVSSDPVEYVRSAILKIFPDSLSMVLEQAESDRNYSGWETIARAIRVKLDVSRIGGVKPEAYYKPLLAGHVAPSVKDSFSTTLHSVVKRNLNTTVNNDPMDTEALWTRAWQAMCKVFYITDADKMLDRHPYIGPHEDAIHEWVSKLDEGKRDRLMAQPGGYTFTELFQGASATQLMVKKKLKPALDASYTTSVKYPQTIQYDPTGQSVAVFSPIIAEKVKLEQSLLRPNILVMQGKSVHDVNVFLNNFDWREDKRGVRRYIEIDYTMFDKSQGHVLAEMYLRALEKFKTLPEYVRFIRDAQHSRTVAAMKAGIKAWLIDQNMSGAAYTLDRNNTIGEMVIAELLVEIIHQIEFVIIMGDDILIAIRGDVNIAHWESELSRKYNLVLKAAIHEHGYICSMDVCHLPDGNTRVVSDVVKRAVSFMDQSMSEEDKFLERYISYCDNLQGVQDVHVQNYLAAALPRRMQSYLPGTSSDAIRMLVQAHAGMLPKYEGDMSGYKLWRSFYSDVKHLRTY